MDAVQTQTSAHHLISFSAEAVDNIFDDLKGRLREATKAHANNKGDGSLYTVSDSDLRLLVDHFSQSINRLPLTDGIVNSTSASPMPKPRHITAPTAVDPATTISVTEAFFPPIVGDQAQDPPKDNGTTATVVSGDNVTEITWIAKHGGTALRGPSGSPTNDESSARAAEDGHKRTQRQTSMVVFTDEDKDEAVDLFPVPQPSARRPSLFARLRNKSVRSSHLEGQPTNGAYHNSNYRPRNESSLFRMRAILDRLEPSRPKQDAAVFTALTGAQPIQPARDYDNIRSMYRDDSCSEDAHQHRCTQHESVPTTPG